MRQSLRRCVTFVAFAYDSFVAAVAQPAENVAARSPGYGATPVTMSPAATAAANHPWPSPPSKPCKCQVPLPQSCNNLGWNYEIYPNVNGNWVSGYPSFATQDYENTTPEQSGTADRLLNLNYTSLAETTFDIYGNQILSDYWVIDYEGYVFACRSGMYKFVSHKVDDIVLVWVGETAISGWTRQNANLEQIYAYPPGGFTGYPGEAPVSFELELEAGKYYPVRVMYGQAQKQAGFHLYLYDPLGGEVIHPGNVSKHIFTESCDGHTAKSFT